MLIGDSIIKHVRMAKTKNLIKNDTSAKERTVLASYSLYSAIHGETFDILWRTTGSKVLLNN